MEQPKGHPCPECGAPRNRDNTPSCTCTQRAADALRDTRTAEAAAAEDFDPLRIRPYVELDDGTPEGGGTPHSSGPPLVAGTPHTGDTPQGTRTPESSRAPAPSDATVPLRAVTPEPPTATDTASVLPAPLTPPPTEPNPTDLSLFEGTGEGTGQSTAETSGESTGQVTAHQPRGRRRRIALIAAAAACVVVVAAAGYASGLFSYEPPSRDTALPDDVRASVPDTSPSPASSAPATSAPAARPTFAPPSPSPTSASPSPSPSPSSASPSPSQPAEPSPSPTTARPTGSPEPSGDSSRQKGNSVLRRGDRGPEVTELQLRLHQLFLYSGETDGDFTSQVEDAVRNYQWSRGVQDDELGVYGRETRAKLESETKEP